MANTAEYARQYRDQRPEYLERMKALATARRRALNKLADLHPAQFVVLIDAECARLGIDPPGSRPDGRPPRAHTGGSDA